MNYDVYNMIFIDQIYIDCSVCCIYMMTFSMYVDSTAMIYLLIVQWLLNEFPV